MAKESDIYANCEWNRSKAPVSWKQCRDEHFADLLISTERDRICKAIKYEDDYCVTEGDYMLDSDDCIAVANGEWARPDYSASLCPQRSQS
jgi:hypothetical protein